MEMNEQTITVRCLSLHVMRHNYRQLFFIREFNKESAYFSYEKYRKDLNCTNFVSTLVITHYIRIINQIEDIHFSL